MPSRTTPNMHSIIWGYMAGEGNKHHLETEKVLMILWLRKTRRRKHLQIYAWVKITKASNCHVSSFLLLSLEILAKKEFTTSLQGFVVKGAFSFLFLGSFWEPWSSAHWSSTPLTPVVLAPFSSLPRDIICISKCRWEGATYGYNLHGIPFIGKNNKDSWCANSSPCLFMFW